MKLLCSLIAIASVSVVLGCQPQHDYTGHYDMTYSLVLDHADDSGREVIGGNALVEIRESFNDQWIIDVGDTFCSLVGDYDRVGYYAPPFLRVDAQACEALGDDYPLVMTLTGNATAYTYDEYQDETDFSISLRGAFEDGESRGIATLEMMEAW